MIRAILSLVVGGGGLFSQVWNVTGTPPANDHYTNRIFLAGNDVTFDGKLAGATRLDFEVMPLSVWSGNYPDKSVWWSWTAQDSTPVTIMAWRPVPVAWLEGALGGGAADVFAVYRPEDPEGGFPTNGCFGCLTAKRYLYAAEREVDFTFTPMAGATYQFQLMGWSTNPVQFRLLATNGPIVMEPPRSMVVAPGASALLTVIAAGVRPFGYQWQRDGTNLPGETAPMLALTNLSTADAGSYRVMVSNATGVTTSEASLLTVRVEEMAPSLTAPGAVSNQFGFQLCAETGRYYGIQVSTNLQTWQASGSFVDPACLFFSNSVVWAGSACMPLAIPMSEPRQFVRAARYVPTNEVCNLRLKQIRFAKRMCGRDTDQGPGAMLTGRDIVPYWKNGQIIGCPEGGPIFLEMLARPPACFVTNHVLQEPY